MPALTQTIDSLLTRPALRGATWGAQVVDLQRGDTLYVRNPGRHMIPASNIKLLTTAAALEQLTPDYRYRTRVYVDGPVEDGVLQGNLIVRGSGDPTIGGYAQEEADDESVTAVFRQWADSLRAAGVDRIAGDIVGDDDVFNDTPLGYGWSWDDAPYAYSAEIGGLVFHQNVIDLDVEGRSPGMPGRLSWEPLNTDYVTVVNRSQTIARWKDDDEEYNRLRGTNTIHVDTRVPAGETEEEDLTVTNPTLYFTHVLREVLLREGIAVSGQAVDVDALSIRPDYAADAVRRVATYTSPPLGDIVADINRESLNLYAEQLLRTLAVERAADSTRQGPPVGSAEDGVRRVKTTLAQAAIDTARVQQVDGSGLSRMNLVSARALVRLLTYMDDHPQPAVRRAFRASLPVGGQDGTLEYRFPSYAPASANVRAKTGTLSNAIALSGYVTAADGTPLAFSLLCNHYIADGSVVRAAQDAVVNALARYRRPAATPPADRQ